MAHDETKTRTIRVRMTEGEYRLIGLAAVEAGISRPEWVRCAAVYSASMDQGRGGYLTDGSVGEAESELRS